MGERVAKRMGQRSRPRSDFDRVFADMPDLVEYRAWRAYVEALHPNGMGRGMIE